MKLSLSPHMLSLSQLHPVIISLKITNVSAVPTLVSGWLLILWYRIIKYSITLFVLVDIMYNVLTSLSK